MRKSIADLIAAGHVQNDHIKIALGEHLQPTSQMVGDLHGELMGHCLEDILEVMTNLFAILDQEYFSFPGFHFTTEQRFPFDCPRVYKLTCNPAYQYCKPPT